MPHGSSLCAFCDTRSAEGVALPRSKCRKRGWSFCDRERHERHLADTPTKRRNRRLGRGCSGMKPLLYRVDVCTFLCVDVRTVHVVVSPVSYCVLCTVDHIVFLVHGITMVKFTSWHHMCCVLHTYSMRDDMHFVHCNKTGRLGGLFSLFAVSIFVSSVIPL